MFDDKMQQLKNRSQYYERRITDKLQELKEWADPKAVWEKVRSGAVTVASDRRTIYVALGVTLSFFLVRALLSRRRQKRMLSSDVNEMMGNTSFEVPNYNPNAVSGGKRNQSLLYELTIMAIQTFLLHYARKMLIKFLEGRDNKKAEPIQPESQPQP